MPFLFKKTVSLDNDYDNEGLRAARSAVAVRTVAPVNGFEKVSDRRITKAERELAKFETWARNFEIYLEIMLKREGLDLRMTQALQQYRSKLAEIVIAKRQAIAVTAVEMQQLRLTDAKNRMAIDVQRQQTDRAIADLQAAQSTLMKHHGWS